MDNKNQYSIVWKYGSESIVKKLEELAKEIVENIVNECNFAKK